MHAQFLTVLSRGLLAGDHPEAREVSLNLEPIGSVLVVLAATLVLFALLNAQATRKDLHEAAADNDHGHH